MIEDKIRKQEARESGLICHNDGINPPIPRKKESMEVEGIMKRCILFLMCALCVCVALPQGALAQSGVTALFTGDLAGQLTPKRG